MRILAEKQIRHYKATIFEMNNRISIKLEDRLLEQTYKFREGSGVDNVSKAFAFLTDSFMDAVDDSFNAMEKARMHGLLKIQEDEGEVFDEII